MRHFVSSLILVLSGCSWDEECENMPFSEMKKAKTVAIMIDYDWGDIIVTNSIEIQSIVTSIENVGGRWADPWYGAPLGGYGAIFYDEKYKKIAEYRISPKRIQLDGCGEERFSRITAVQREALFKAIKQKDVYLNRDGTNGFLDWLIDLYEL